MKNSFKDDIIWIIGASTGIGRQLATQLASRGANIILSARSKESLQDVLKTMQHNDHEIIALDVGNSKAIHDAREQIIKKYGRIDRTIFMAGIYDPTSCSSMTVEQINSTIDINLKGPLYLTEAILPLYNQQKQGQLVLCASVAGYFGLPNGQPYSSSKAGIINLAETLKTEYQGSNIDIKLINPGFVKTRLTDKNKFDMPFLMEPEEAANCIVKGLKSNCFEINFPKKLTYIMKMIGVLPYLLYFKLISLLPDLE